MSAERIIRSIPSPREVLKSQVLPMRRWQFISFTQSLTLRRPPKKNRRAQQKAVGDTLCVTRQILRARRVGCHKASRFWPFSALRYLYPLAVTTKKTSSLWSQSQFRLSQSKPASTNKLIARRAVACALLDALREERGATC